MSLRKIHCLPARTRTHRIRPRWPPAARRPLRIGLVARQHRFRVQSRVVERLWQHRVSGGWFGSDAAAAAGGWFLVRGALKKVRKDGWWA